MQGQNLKTMYLSPELVVFQRAVVERGWEAEAMLDQRPLSCLIRREHPPDRESSLLTTYLSESTVLGELTSRHGSLNSLFQVALHLPS